MPHIFNGSLDCVTWETIKDSIKKINPCFFDLLDPLPNINNIPFYKASYAYGANIIKNGILYLPNSKGRVVPLSDDSIPKTIKDELSYTAIPISMLLHNNSEVFNETEDCTIPVRLFEPGEFFGLFELFEENTNIRLSATNVNAGARSLFALPHIKNKKSYHKLSKLYKCDIPIPKTKLDHHSLFSIIAYKEGGIELWKNEVLFFSKDLVRKILENKDFAHVQNYFLKKAWFESDYLRNQPMYDQLWKVFADSINNRNLKPRPDLIDLVKHLIFISKGTIPGFRPTGLSTASAPIDTFQKVLIDQYGLIDYFPTIMAPFHCATNKNKPAYYGIALPTVLKCSVETKQFRSIATDLRDLRLLITTLQTALKKKNNYVSQFLDATFTYFHDEYDDYSEIIPATEIPEDDKEFTQCYFSPKDAVFCERNSFTRGCVKIMLNTDKD